MTKRTGMGIVLMAVVVALAGTACRRGPDVIVQKAMDQARSLMEQGNVDGAVAALQRTYDDQACESFRPQLLGAMVQIHLSTNRVEAAQALFNDALRRNPAEAGSVVGLIEEALFNAGRLEDLAAWCSRLRTLGLPEEALATVAEYHCRALEARGAMADLIAALPDYLARLSEAAGFGLIERRFNVAMGAKALERAEAIVKLASGGPASQARTGLVTRLRVDLLLAQGKRAEAITFFKGQVSGLSDNEASAVMYRLFQATTKAGEVKDADALCRFVVDTVKDRATLRDSAAGLWVGNVQGDGVVTGIIDRLAAIRKDGFSAEFVARQIDRHYKTIMEQGTKADFLPLLEFCRALAPEVQGEDRARLSGTMLDLCFYLDRFADALVIVEQGIPGHDAKWTLSLTAKIKAHLCLQQGKPREAVAHFREFMNVIAQDTTDQVDPVTGTRVTKDMILGLNAKRIGDILAADGDKDGAAKAYQEARGAYAKALAGFREDSPEYAKIKQDTAAIPGEGR
jgi:tetratricopeptide (TPR) repeat protein